MPNSEQSLLDRLIDSIGEDRSELLSFRLEPDHVKGDYDNAPIQAGRHYFRVTLTRMFLKRRKVSFGRNWFPAVHSLVECAFGDDTVQIPNIANTNTLFEKAGTRDVVARSFHLTPLLPFKDGTVKLGAALFALQGDRHLKNVITVMSDFAGLLAAPQISTALSLAKPLAKGLDTLFGANDKAMHLGYTESFVGLEGGGNERDGVNYLREGYMAVVRAPEDQVSKDKLWVVDQHLRKGESLDENVVFDDHDYMLLHVELREKRDDYDQLKNIKDPFDAALQALVNSEGDKAETQIRLAIVEAMQSPELTRADKVRIVTRLKADFQQAKQDLDLEGVGSLQASLAEATSVGDATEADLPTYQQLFADL